VAEHRAGVRQGRRKRVPRLFAALALARGDGRYAKLMRQFACVDLLILDDWGPEPLLPEQQRDLLEIVEDSYGASSVICRSLDVI
jgi:DNA replication protein DnaC